jgi:hypothetical protein
VRGTVHRLKREIGNDEDDLLSLVDHADNEDKEH